MGAVFSVGWRAASRARDVPGMPDRYDFAADKVAIPKEFSRSETDFYMVCGELDNESSSCCYTHDNAS